MPGIIGPGEGIQSLTKGYDWSPGSSGGGGEFPGAKAPQATRAWTRLNLAVASSLPTQLVLAGRYQHATLTLLRRRSRVR